MNLSDPLTIAALVATALIAGCVDAIAGGGGLLTVPALALAGLDPRTAIATNKLQSSFGSGSATLAFARAGHIGQTSLPYALTAAAGSMFGALALAHVPQRAVTVALPFVLLGVALYFAMSPKLGDTDRHRRIPVPAFIGGIAPLIGFYDGVFGPGAGSFYMAGFVALLGFGVLKATAHTKLANFASNLAGLATLALSGHMLWGIGLAMGGAQFVGARIGSRMAMRHGARLVKPLLISISVILAIKLALAEGHPIRSWIGGLTG